MLDEKASYIETILEKIFDLDDPAIDKSREQEIRDFITRTINGDMPKKYFVINIEDVGVIFILTNLRVIRIDIDKQKIQSSSFVLSGITIETKKLHDEERLQTKLVFQGSSFGLIYPVDDKNALDFFQEVDAQRVERN